MNSKLELRFGALAPTIEKQLELQHFKFDKKKVAIMVKQIHAINVLRFHNNMITDSVANKLFDKMFKVITKHVNSNNAD